MSLNPTIASLPQSNSLVNLNLKPAVSPKLAPKKLQTSLKLIRRLPETSIPKEQDKDLLVKVRPRKVTIDKEQLYQENLQLKLKNHSLNEEIMRVRTKLIQYEQETFKSKSKEPGQWDKSSSASLNSNLKQVIKELKNRLESKDQENFKLRSNLKCSRNNELEAELQAYIDECTRLKYHLEETLAAYEEVNQHESVAGQAYESLQQSNTDLEKTNKTLQDEVKGLKTILESFQKRKKSGKRKKYKAEIQKLRLILESKEKFIKELETKISQLKEEKPKQDANLSLTKKLNQNFPTFKPAAPSFFRVIQACQNKTKGLKDFLAVLKTMKSAQQVSEYIKQLYPKFNEKDLAEIFTLFHVSKIEVLHDLIREWFDFFDYNEYFEWVKPEKEDSKTARNEPIFQKTGENKQVIKNIRKSPDFEIIQPKLQKGKALDHKDMTAGRTSPIFLVQSDLTISQEMELSWMWEKISMALQINRLSSKEFFKFLPEKIDQKHFSKILMSDPFSFSQNDAEKYSSVLFISIPAKEKSNLSHYINELFKKNTKYWEVLDQEKEDLLNSELSMIIDKHKNSILEKCGSYDIKSTGKITLEQFRLALNSLGLRCSEDLWNYLKLLLYSCNEEINTAPYLYFIENFGKGPEGGKEIAGTVRKYIEIIAEKLIQLKLSTKSAFDSTAGYIFPKQFVKSLEKLGIKDIPKPDLKALLQSLQDEQSDAPCIALDEFQEILNNYGVDNRTEVSADNEDTIKVNVESYEDDCESYSQEFND